MAKKIKEQLSKVSITNQLVIGFIIILLGIFSVGIYSFKEFKYFQKNNSFKETTAIIKELKKDSYGNELVVMEYTAEDNVYNMTSDYSSLLSSNVGDKVKIKYKETNPKNTIIIGEDKKNNNFLYGGIITIAGGIILIIMMKSYKKYSDKLYDIEKEELEEQERIAQEEAIKNDPFKAIAKTNNNATIENISQPVIVEEKQEEKEEITSAQEANQCYSTIMQHFSNQVININAKIQYKNIDLNNIIENNEISEEIETPKTIEIDQEEKQVEQKQNIKDLTNLDEIMLSALASIEENIKNNEI